MTLKEEMLFKMQTLGIHPKRSMGQNFLIGEHVVEKIFDCVDRRAPSYIVEIGPGLGALTERLIERGLPHQLIELDTLFAEYWRKRGENVIEVDALKFDWSTLKLPVGTLLLSNLPYQISSRLVIELSSFRHNIDLMVLMFQKEVAERLVAPIRTKDYGFLSVVAQSFWSMDRLVDASPSDFYPSPNVSSRVMSFKQKEVVPELNQEYIQFVKTAFQFRRKYMLKAFGDQAEALRPILINLGYKDQARAEELAVLDFQKLFLEHKKSLK